MEILVYFFSIVCKLIGTNYSMPVPLISCGSGLMLSVGFLCGNKLSQMQIPERPLLSPFLQHAGSFFRMVSEKIIIIVFTIMIIAIISSSLTGKCYLPAIDVYILSIFIAIGLMGGVLISIPIIYRWLPLWERGQGLDDIKYLASRLKKLTRGFDPEYHFNVRKGIFFGLNDRRSPLIFPKESLQKNHIQIVGESGTGKSSLSGVLLAQCALLGETVIIIDPKNDAFLSSALFRISQKNKLNFNFIDLRPSAPAQLNPLKDCNPWQVEELLVAGFELGKSGDPGSDYYRGEDRDACAEVANRFAAGATTIPSLFQACAKCSEVTDRTNFWREFRHLASLQAFHAKDGFDLQQVIESGGILYIVGSITSDKVFAAQRLLLQRILQIISERNLENARPVALMLDEIKYILSVPAIRALGTVRDRNCHIIVAHQSLGDLDDCAGLDPRAVRGAVHGNTSLKIAYKLNEYATALEFEGIGGKEKTYVENINTMDDHHSRGWRESERPRVRADLLTHLPKPTRGESSVGVLFGLGPARLVSTRYLEAGPKPQIVVAEADMAIFTTEDLI